MILGGFYPDDYEPPPPPAGSLDEALNERGYEPSADLFRPPRTDIDLGDWQDDYTTALELGKHLLSGDCHIADCGARRCERCDERLMCTGPEPRACGTTCVDCDCSCDTCLMVREEMRAELQCKIERESYGNA